VGGAYAVACLAGEARWALNVPEGHVEKHAGWESDHSWVVGGTAVGEFGEKRLAIDAVIVQLLRPTGLAEVQSTVSPNSYSASRAPENAERERQMKIGRLEGSLERFVPPAASATPQLQLWVALCGWHRDLLGAGQKRHLEWSKTMLAAVWPALLMLGFLGRPEQQAAAAAVAKMQMCVSGSSVDLPDRLSPGDPRSRLPTCHTPPRLV